MLHLVPLPVELVLFHVGLSSTFRSATVPFLSIAKKQHMFLDNGINQARALLLFIRLTKNKYCKKYSIKKRVTADGTMGSKSKANNMKSYRINKKEAEPKLKNQKRENALDIISKSIFKAFRRVRVGSIN